MEANIWILNDLIERYKEKLKTANEDEKEKIKIKLEIVKEMLKKYENG